MILRTLLLLMIVVSKLPAQSLPTVVYNTGYLRSEQLPYTHSFALFNPFETLLEIDSIEVPCTCLSLESAPLVLAPKRWDTLSIQLLTLETGNFEKTFTLHSTQDFLSQNFILKGFLLPKRDASHHYFSKSSDAMRLIDTVLSFQTARGLVDIDSFIVYNISMDTLYFSSETYVPSYLQISFSPTALPPQEIGAWRISYMPLQRLHDRYQLNKLQVQARTSVKSLQPVDVFVGSLGAELPTFPLSNPTKPSLHLDKVVASLHRPVFVVENRGGSVLRIKHIRSNCACVSMRPSVPIEVTAFENISLTFSVCSKPLHSSHILKVYSNDPQKPVQKLWITPTQ